MIVFLGDSFTWGQGLQIPYWLEQGKSVGEINKLMPPKFPSEQYDYEADELRKKQHFPNLVSKYFNKSYCTKWGNGGSNQDILEIIKNLGNQMDTSGIDYFVIQFTEFTRDSNLDNLSPTTSFEQYREEIVKEVDKTIKNYYNKSWFGLSWRDNFGNILELKYPKNHIPIEFNNKVYSHFEPLLTNNYNLCLADTTKVHDGHFNSHGHQVVADSIIKKIKH
jgi:lysophospholipase L1-like esterase